MPTEWPPESPEGKLLQAIFGRQGERMDFTVKRSFGMGLCDRCDHAFQVRLESGREFTYCRVGMERVRVTGRVVECSDFEAQNVMPLWEMKKIAWYVDTEEGKVVGFVRPGTEKHRNFYRGSREE